MVDDLIPPKQIATTLSNHIPTILLNIFCKLVKRTPKNQTIFNNFYKADSLTTLQVFDESNAKMLRLQWYLSLIIYLQN